MTAATGAPQSPSQGIHMRASALRDDGLAGASNRLLGRSVTGESVLYNLALLAAAGRPLEECSALEIGCSSWVALRDLIAHSALDLPDDAGDVRGHVDHDLAQYRPLPTRPRRP